MCSCRPRTGEDVAAYQLGAADGSSFVNDVTITPDAAWFTDADLPAVDGILLQGRTLSVVRNRFEEIAVLRLSPDLTSAMLTDTLTDPDFAVPTTVAAFGPSLYAVNARFGTPDPAQTTYEIVKVDGS